MSVTTPIARNVAPPSVAPILTHQDWRSACSHYAPPCLLGGILVVLGWILSVFWVPADGGVDQNAYLVAARLMADEHRFGFIPEDPHDYIGDMMIQTEDGRMLAKYPPGFPLLAAIARTVSGPKAAYVVNPLCATLACLFAYLLFRQLLDHFCSLVATLLLAMNPVTLSLASTPSSHASGLLCVCIGFWSLLRWLHHRSWRSALVGAFALGFLATIRYSEALVFLPLGFVIIITLGRTRKSMIKSLALLLSWSIPIAILASYCWYNFGAPWKTGYSYCAEDTSFSLSYIFGDASLQGHWETLVTQINWLGLFMLWPLAMVGLIALIAERWKTALCLLLWLLPPTVLYLGYYYAPTSDTSLGYLRFFLTLYPGLILAAVWLLQRATLGLGAVRAIALGSIAALAVVVNLGNAIPRLSRSHASSLALAQIASMVDARVPSNSCIFIADEHLSNHLDAWGGHRIVNGNLFSTSSYSAWKHIAIDPRHLDEPEARQRSRMRQYLDMITRRDPEGRYFPQKREKLVEAQSAFISKQFALHRRVFFLLTTPGDLRKLPAAEMWKSQPVETVSSYAEDPSVTRTIGAGNPAGWTAGEDPTRPRPPVSWTLFEVTPR